jgi:hypothetical protein
MAHPPPEEMLTEAEQYGEGEPDPAICPGCSADLRAVGLLEHEPCWVHYRWAFAEGEWHTSTPSVQDVGDHLHGIDSIWLCRACGGLVSSTEEIGGE